MIPVNHIIERIANEENNYAAANDQHSLSSCMAFRSKVLNWLSAGVFY